MVLPAGKIPDRNNDRADVEKLTRIRDLEWKTTAGDCIQPAQTRLPSVSTDRWAEVLR